LLRVSTLLQGCTVPLYRNRGRVMLALRFFERRNRSICLSDHIVTTTMFSGSSPM
jgi:hypothetical protein